MGNGIQHFVQHVVLAHPKQSVAYGLGVFLSWLGSEMLIARTKFKRLDRTHYHLCDRHGAIRHDRMIVVDAFEDGQPVPSMCPLCYEDKINDAKRRHGL